MRTTRSILAASAAAILLTIVAGSPAMASSSGYPPINPISPPPVPGGPYVISDLRVPAITLPTCKQLLAPGTTALFGATPRYLGDLSDPVTHAGYGTRLLDLQAIIEANGGRTCTWQIGGAIVTVSLSAISESNRRAVDASWWNSRRVDGMNTGGINTLYHFSGKYTESAYLLDEPLYLTATSTDGTWFPAFVQLEADWVYELRH